MQIGQITRVVDQFLQQASLNAQAQSGSSGAMSSMLDQAQQLFGDPSTSTGYFSQLEQTFADITSAIQSPSSTVPRDQVVADVQNFLSQSSSISSQLQQLSVQADSQISDNVTKANNLLSQISQLNQSIVAEKASGGGAAGSQNAQSALVDQLSSLLDVKVSARADGGVDIRAGEGSLLVGTGGAATLSYSSSGATAGQLMVTQANGQARQLTANSGALQGLLAMRNQQLPSISSQLDQYVSQAVDQINRAHNASTAVPPPNTLTGANTGLDLPTALSGFTGKSSIGVVDQNGVVQQQVDIDFGAGKMSINGSAAAAVSFTPSTFLATLNTELGGKATASFSNGALSISAATSTNGIAIGDDATTPSGKAGRGFSDFFGLNDLITSSGYPNAGTGLQGTDSNGFTAGGQITIRLQDANGSTLRLAQVTVPSGGTMSGLVAALNSSQTGVGLYGAFNLDAKGQLTFTPSQQGVSMTVMGDNSQWGTSGPSISQLFGLPSTGQSPLAQSFSVRADIADDSMKLALGQFDPTIGAGNQALAVGDSRGGQLLANIGQNTVQFGAAGSFGALSTTLSNYGAQFAGAIAQKASSADSNNSNAQSLATEAQSRRSSVEGVSMDQELVNLTTYQQAYNANARLLQAVSQLYQTLLNIQ